MSLPRGNTAREEREISNRHRFQEKSKIFPIGIKTPLEKGSKENETLFRMNYKIEDQINDNLKNLLMTKKGERLCHSDYGTTLYEIYSSDSDTETISQYAMNEISLAVEKYMPSINLVNYYSELLTEENDILKIQQDNTKIARQKTGLEFYSSLSEVKTTQKGSITRLNNNNNSDIIYQITIEYTIPSLNRENNKIFSLTMNLITSK